MGMLTNGSEHLLNTKTALSLGTPSVNKVAISPTPGAAHSWLTTALPFLLQLWPSEAIIVTVWEACRVVHIQSQHVPGPLCRPVKQTESHRPGALPKGTDFPCRQTWTHSGNKTWQVGNGGRQHGTHFTDESSQNPSVWRFHHYFIEFKWGKGRGGAGLGKRRN